MGEEVDSWRIIKNILDVRLLDVDYYDYI